MSSHFGGYVEPGGEADGEGEGGGGLGDGGGGEGLVGGVDGMGDGADGFGSPLEAKSTGNQCGGTALLSNRRAWAVTLGRDEVRESMVLVPAAPARTRPCARWKRRESGAHRVIRSQ